jgi:citrate lyase subunit beta/citryl-CoA lyase
VQNSAKSIIVRINAPGSAHFEGDLMAFACPQVALLNLPKAQSAADVAARRARSKRPSAATAHAADRAAGQHRDAAGAAARSGNAAAHPRVAGLQLGLADLFESMHADRRSAANVHAAMFQMAMACAESGKFAYDSAYPDVADTEDFAARRSRRAARLRRQELRASASSRARQRDFGAATLDIDTARRIVAAAQDAAQAGRGAFLLDGRMIDLPFVKRAEAVLAAANDAAIAVRATHRPGGARRQRSGCSGQHFLDRRRCVACDRAMTAQAGRVIAIDDRPVVLQPGIVPCLDASRKNWVEARAPEGLRTSCLSIVSDGHQTFALSGNRLIAACIEQRCADATSTADLPVALSSAVAAPQNDIYM